MNTLYRSYFTEPYPARTTIQAGALPLGISIEIEVIASQR
jgi:2-iminobutanoate/2-iminopropanoate deaminase